MAKRRKTTRRASTPARTRTVYRTAPRKRYHKKSDASYIPGAGATVGLVIANANALKELGGAVSTHGAIPMANSLIKDPASRGYWVKKFVSSDALVKSAVGLAGGYVAGEAVKKFAPGIIKKPIGKLSKKVPRVIK